MNALNVKTFGGLLSLFLVMAVLLFVLAGTLHYWQAWTFLAAYFAASLAITIYLIKKDPALLQRRMSGGPVAEKEPVQKIIMFFTSLGFIALLVVPALDHRFAWSDVPPYAALAGDMLVLIGWLVIFFVFRENSFASATIELARTRKSYRPVRTRWCGTRCMWEALSCFSACRLRSVRCGACSSSSR